MTKKFSDFIASVKASSTERGPLTTETLSNRWQEHLHELCKKMDSEVKADAVWRNYIDKADVAKECMDWQTAVEIVNQCVKKEYDFLLKHASVNMSENPNWADNKIAEAERLNEAWERILRG